MPLAKDSNLSDNGEEYSTFMLAFVGEFVEIVAMLSSEVTEGTISTNGYLLDYDDEYYYLGADAEEITHCVKRNKVTLIQVKDPDNIYTEMLMEMDVPADEQSKN